MSARACGLCDHDPACGHASVYHDQPVTIHKRLFKGGKNVWLCHDDDHSCYERWAMDKAGHPLYFDGDVST
jgi:hypothetical protein